MNWQPSASLETLHLRAQILAQTRSFFADRNVLEVETPLLCHTSVTDPFIQSIPAQPIPNHNYFLQTSPEYAMKRLLAHGSGSIYQISKAFRQEEIGHLHNPEFTLLEWYQVGYDHHDLMNEVDLFIQTILKTKPAQKVTYAQLFQEYLDLDPHLASLNVLESCAKKYISLHTSFKEHSDRDTLLHLLFTHCLEPQLNSNHAYFVYDFPATQAALARIQNTQPKVASRFEVYFKGMELANGFHELNDAKEQRYRFQQNNLARLKLGLKEMMIDELFLSSLETLPNCAGVALGLDRLIMIAAHCHMLSQVLSFDFSRV